MRDKQTQTCNLRYAIRVTGSKRLTYCCRNRDGFMLAHWKCVGYGNEGCPKKGEEER